MNWRRWLSFVLTLLRHVRRRASEFYRIFNFKLAAAMSRYIEVVGLPK
jgi:hypothetical protein